MKKALKKCTALMLVFLMVLTLLPAMASAAEVEAKWGSSASTLPNSGTLSAAFAANPAYIQLQTSVTLNAGITVSSGTVTLDLNGQTITAGTAGITPISVDETGTLTLIDSTGGGEIIGGADKDSSAVCVGWEKYGGTLNIGNGTSTKTFTLKAGNDDYSYGLSSLGTVVVNQEFSVEAASGGSAISSSGTFTGNDKHITAKGQIGIVEGTATGLNATVTDANDALVIGYAATEVSITGGSYTGTRYGLWLRSTSEDAVKISGGTFSGGKAAIKNGGSDTYAGILADGCVYTNGENDNAITEETTLAAAKKLEVRSGGSSTEYSISVSVEGTGGTASASASTAAEGTEISLTAEPAEGYAFKEWKVIYPTNLTITENKFTMPAGNVEIKAVFEAEPSGTSPTVTTATLPNGRVEEEYSQTLSATGDIPISWSIESGSLPTELSLDSSTGVISGTPTADGTFTFTVKAQNSAGSDSQEFTIEIYPKLTSAFTISVSADPAEGGTANGGGTYNANETATVTATVKTGYRFVKWTENGNEVSTDAAYSFAVTANRTLVAVFELIPATPVAPVAPVAPVDPDPQSPPAITSPTTDQEVFVYVNSNATMSIDAKDAKTYQWYVDRGNGFEAISGATDASYTTSKVELKNDGYRYYCVATNAYGTDISPIFTLNVTKDIVTPKTGDNAQNGLWTGLIMIAAAGLCACTVVWRKRSQA